MIKINGVRVNVFSFDPSATLRDLKIIDSDPIDHASTGSGRMATLRLRSGNFSRSHALRGNAYKAYYPEKLLWSSGV